MSSTTERKMMDRDQISIIMREQLERLAPTLRKTMLVFEGDNVAKGDGLFILLHISAMTFAEKYIEDGGKPDDIQQSIDAILKSFDDMLYWCYAVVITNRRDREPQDDSKSRRHEV